MKFDVIVGNPPYQIDSDGNTRTRRPIYHLLRRAGHRDEPRYVVMITPSRWFAGGSAWTTSARKMIKDRRSA